MQFIFTNYAKKQFEKLQKDIQKFIVQRIQIYRETGTWNIKQLVDMKPATHRIRVGDYRLILKKHDSETWIVLKVWHRKEIYK